MVADNIRLKLIKILWKFAKASKYYRNLH